MGGRVKGVNILSLVKMLRAAGRERAMACLPSAMHSYLNERILVSNQYPEEDHLALLRAVSQMMPKAPDPWIVMGHASAHADLTGIYRAHLRPGEPQRTLQSAHALWRNYHDTGEMTVVLVDERQVRLELRRFVAPAWELCRINIGYFTELVLLSGGSNVRCTQLGCVTQKADHCSWSLTWT